MGHGFSHAVTPLRFLSFLAAVRPRGICSSDSPNATARPISASYLVYALALTQLAEGNLRGTNRPGPLARPERTRVVQANHLIISDCPHPVNAAFCTYFLGCHRADVSPRRTCSLNRPSPFGLSSRGRRGDRGIRCSPLIPKPTKATDSTAAS